tara:strand:+ start:406 stop:1551 length:1146 start_codon:yes stop_codon:yes gene_type:complete
VTSFESYLKEESKRKENFEVTISSEKEETKTAKGWNRENKTFEVTKGEPYGKINLNPQIAFGNHRSGWNYAVEALAPLHNPNGVFFDGFLEKNFSWQRQDNIKENIIPYKKPWIGFFHNPPFKEDWFFGFNSLDRILKIPELEQSMDSCMGLFTLSEDLADFLRRETGKKVSWIYHPTEIPEKIFNFERFLHNENKLIIQVGYWLRKPNSIYLLPLNKESKYKKTKLIPYENEKIKDMISHFEVAEKQNYDIQFTQEHKDNTFLMPRKSDEDYDELLSRNIVFLDLYATSANNAVIECIARTTPLLINRLPATELYLGKDYPFFFSSLDEAAEKCLDLNLVKRTHEYLKNWHVRKKLSQEYFRFSIEQSEVYKSLSNFVHE